ncbi:aminoacyl-tRNA hydrolase [Ammoniphilus sp. CFH 90114]|uniref:aminoacyl-tRNA hydrolase n=1 Tax=Ammoniphilus sp. CFH 90114 TaxID=2493665 RepID=UPI00100F54D1|nr:aminoacyl-tRNA hydrolase [Ammoniphilus sp. CFH 90114]RXT09005.1 aminoacyl-tRNA hydrolase [Ammoniphilus sp. CFH 90114]
MKLIVGLGNPGKQYEKTRHNAGFMAVDECARTLGIDMNQLKFKGMYGVGHVKGEKVILLKPLTYMNLSGESIIQVMQFFKLETDQLVVIYDDLDTAVGQIRVRMKGSAGGHNGIKSIIQHLGTEEFYRIRVGIGRPPAGRKVVDYVLEPFHQEEEGDIQSAVKKASEAANSWLEDSFVQVMNRFN